MTLLRFVLSTFFCLTLLSAAAAKGATFRASSLELRAAVGTAIGRISPLLLALIIFVEVCGAVAVGLGHAGVFVPLLFAAFTAFRWRQERAKKPCSCFGPRPVDDTAAMMFSSVLLLLLAVAHWGLHRAGAPPPTPWPLVGAATAVLGALTLRSWRHLLRSASDRNDVVRWDTADTVYAAASDIRQRSRSAIL